MRIDSPEKESMRLAEEYLKKRYEKVENVSKKRGEEFSGCDFICDNKIKIEVKGSTRENGIPDPYETEFKEGSKEMVADFMYIFYFPREVDWNELDKSEYYKKALFYIIPRGAIPQEEISVKKGWRLSQKFKNCMDEFKKDFSLPTGCEK